MSTSGHRHLATPDGGSGPGVLLLHEARGLTEDIVWAASRLADAGYVVTAPDLTPEMGGVTGAVGQLLAGRGALVDRALDEVDVLAAHGEVTSPGVAVVGFSMGAALSLLLDRHPAIRAIAFNYGLVSRHALAHRDIPVVASFGTGDRLLPRGARPLGRLLASSNLEHDTEEYEGAGHSFMTPVSSEGLSWITRLLGLGWEPASAHAAWNRMLEFLDSRMKETHIGEATQSRGF